MYHLMYFTFLNPLNGAHCVTAIHNKVSTMYQGIQKPTVHHVPHEFHIHHVTAIHNKVGTDSNMMDGDSRAAWCTVCF